MYHLYLFSSLLLDCWFLARKYTLVSTVFGRITFYVLFDLLRVCRAIQKRFRHFGEFDFFRALFSHWCSLSRAWRCFLAAQEAVFSNGTYRFSSFFAPRISLGYPPWWSAYSYFMPTFSISHSTLAWMKINQDVTPKNFPTPLSAVLKITIFCFKPYFFSC